MCDDLFDMIPLEFDHAIFHGTSRTAERSERFPQPIQGFRIHRHATHKGYPLTFAAFGFSGNADNTIHTGNGGIPFAGTRGSGLMALGTHPALFC